MLSTVACCVPLDVWRPLDARQLRNYNDHSSVLTEWHAPFPALTDWFAGRRHTLKAWQVCLVIAGVSTMASGCTNSSQTPPPPPPVAQPSGPVSVNGAFNGIMQLVEGPPASCGTQDMLTLNVVNNAFSYTLNQPQVPGQPTRTFNVMIASDGSYQASSGAAFIRGTASSGHMSGDIFGDACGFHFEADNSGSW